LNPSTITENYISRIMECEKYFSVFLNFVEKHFIEDYFGKIESKICKIVTNC
jgi:hypothetical protein